MGLSNNGSGPGGGLSAAIGPLRFVSTKKQYDGPYRVVLADPIRYYTIDTQEELEPMYPPPNRGIDPNDIISR